MSTGLEALAAMYQRLVQIDGYKWTANYDTIRQELWSERGIMLDLQARAEKAEASLEQAANYCARPPGVCLPARPDINPETGYGRVESV